MAHEAYQLKLPARLSSCAVFASPHSGRDYPWHFLRDSLLDELEIRSSEDGFVDILFDAAPRFGAPLIAARAPRAYVDLNRAADELDPALIEDVRARGSNPRIASGLGVIPRVVSNGKPIRKGKISLTEAQTRLETWYHPYHRRLRALLDEVHTTFGRAILFDCHSMPHDALRMARFPNNARPQVVLGDLFGASCDREIVEVVESYFVENGLSVARNSPFAGAFTMRQYGRPGSGYHALQIEVDRSLYMNEEKVRPNGNFAAFKAVIDGLVERLTRYGREQMPLAAE